MSSPAAADANEVLAARQADLPGWREALIGIAQAVYLDALWLIGCCGIVTAPAATTALLAAVNRWRTTGEPPSARRFGLDVRNRLLIDGVLGLVTLMAAAVLALDLFAIGNMGVGRRALLVLWISLTVPVGLVTTCIPVASAAILRGRPKGGLLPTVRIARRRRIFGAVRLAAVTVLAGPFSAVLALVTVVLGVALVTVSPLSLLIVPVAVAALVDRVSSGTAAAHRME